MSRARRFVTVVSGIPRAGTSLVMQMLAAGGMPLLTDAARPPDPDNPRGYFEYAAVKGIARDAGFVALAVGRALKVVAPLVRHLPATLAYRVLLVERRMDEVLASQERMLVRRGAVEPDAIAPERLAEIYAAQLAEARAWIAATPGAEALAVAHGELLRDPARLAAAIAAFLGGGLDLAAMRAAVDPALHRQRSGRSAEWTPPPQSPIVRR